MRTKKIGKYLDTGSLDLFARQIVETLQNVLSVAIHDSGGQLVWAGPDEDGRQHWVDSSFTRNRVPGPGFCERLKDRHLVYVFYLGSQDTEHPSGTVSVLVHSSHPLSFEFAHAEVEAIIGCIGRQLEINSELSAIRRMSKEGRRGLELLVRLDELNDERKTDEQIRQMLEVSAAHFETELAAVLLPDSGIREVRPAKLLAEEATSKAVMSALGSLFSTAKLHRKVLLADAGTAMRDAVGLTSRQSKLLCCPIMNAKDDVVGILVLARATPFERDHVRLARAICVKLHAHNRPANRPQRSDYTRHTLLDYIDKTCQCEPGQSQALLHIDIDKLHVVNDNYGHLAGDVVIEHVRKVIADFANADDALSNLSGDCFGLFLCGVDERSARDRAQLILETLARKHVEFQSVDIAVSASIGIVMVPDVATNGAAALNTAEIAARSAKSRGGNRCVIFQDADASVAQRRTDLDQVNNLQYALIQNRFMLHAQPIVPLQEDEGPARYEILIRMLDEKGETIPSASFISAAERYQMMSAIDRWVIKTTLDQLGGADNMVEVNLSRFAINLSAQSIADDDFFEYIEACVAESGISPDSLCFEITETAVVKNLERARRFIRRLRQLGCMVALDDFGTGYCSFAYLKDLPVHYVKIDGVFVRDILQNTLSEAIISSMVEIAKVMRASTVAEHVENELIFQQMRNLGIDFAQGFATGRPAPLANILSQLGEPLLLDADDDTSIRSA